MAPQPAIVFTLSAPLDPGELAQFATDKAGMAIRVRTSERFPSWWFEVPSGVEKPDVELQFEGDEVLITYWPEYPHEYFVAIAEAFVVSRGAKPRYPNSARDARGRLLVRHTWEQYRSRVLRRRRLAGVAAVLLIAVVLATLAVLRR